MAVKKPAETKKAATTDKLATRKPQQEALATQDMQALFEQNAGAGMENVGQKDLAIPRIGIIQSNSPQVKKGEGKYIKGAEEGDFLDSVANAVFAKGDEGFIFIPCSYRRANIEWIPRKKGGGFVADHGADDSIFQQCTKDEETGGMFLKNGNEVVTTGEFIGIALNEDGSNAREIVLSLAKTAFAAAKKVNTYTSTLQVKRSNGAGTFNPPSFYSAFAVTSIPATSKKTGDSYMTWQIVKKTETSELGEDIVQRAFALYKAAQMGTLNVAPPDAGGQQEPEGNDSSL